MKFSLEITQQNAKNEIKIPEEAEFLIIPDNPFGKIGPGSVPMAYFLKNRYNMKVIATINTRDRNVIGIGSEILAALELGLDGLFVVKGDSTKKFSEVRDLNVFEVIAMIKKYRYIYGSDMLIGATINFVRGNEFRIVKKKMENGADFFISQAVYDQKIIEKNKWIKYLSAPVYIGIIPILSKKIINFYAKNLFIPDKVVQALRNSENLKNENLLLFSEIIHKSMDIVEGYHIMPLENVSFADEIIRKVRKW